MKATSIPFHAPANALFLAYLAAPYWARQPLPAWARRAHAGVGAACGLLLLWYDSFFPPLDEFETEIEHLEETVTGRPTPQDRERLLMLGRWLVELRKRVSPQRDILARQMDEILALPGFEAGSRDYFRDVYDHLLRIYEEIESHRERLASALQLYVSAVSNRLNEVMERLTLIATIFLPLTVITGFFGQNFGWLVRHINTQADFLIFGATVSS